MSNEAKKINTYYKTFYVVLETDNRDQTKSIETIVVPFEWDYDITTNSCVAKRNGEIKLKANQRIAGVLEGTMKSC